jgi:ribonuclease P protein component
MLPRAHRLRSNQGFKQVYARGRSYTHPMLVLYVRPTRGVESRIGFSIGKKLGGAVQRNRIKRRLREVCRARLDRLPSGFDAVFVGRSALKTAAFSEIRVAVDALLKRARLLEGEEG